MMTGYLPIVDQVHLHFIAIPCEVDATHKFEIRKIVTLHRVSGTLLDIAPTGLCTR